MPNLIPTLSDAYWTGKPAGYSAPVTYGSARGGVVGTPATDEEYKAWLAVGHNPWPWPHDASGVVTVAALDAVLATYGLPATGLHAPSSAELVAYVARKRAMIENGGVSVNAGTDVAPIMISVDTTPTGKANIWGLALQATMSLDFTTTWYQTSGSVALNESQIIKVAKDVGAWVAALYAIEASAVTRIEANPPTITALAHIDGLTWPANS